MALVCLLSRQEVSGSFSPRLLWDLIECCPGETQPCLQADWTGFVAYFAKQQALLLSKCSRNPKTQERPDCILLEEPRHWVLSGPKQVLKNLLSFYLFPFITCRVKCFACHCFRLAAIALLYLDQEDAFWTLVATVEVFMPRDYYTKTLLGSQVNEIWDYVVILEDKMVLAAVTFFCVTCDWAHE